MSQATTSQTPRDFSTHFQAEQAPGDGFARPRPGPVTAPDGITGRRADALYAWLLTREGDELPALGTIAAALPAIGTTKLAFASYRVLEADGRIEQRHGTRSWAKGHRIVRIVATSKVLRTPLCPLTFDLPPNLRAHQIAEATKRRVLDAIEQCAARRVFLPGTASLGKRLGRSDETIRRALAALHDEGAIQLFQRGMRRGARLPDGRSTL